MPTPIKITVGKTSLSGELFESACARQIIDKLPLEAMVNEWGDEFYFEIPIRASLDKTGTTRVKVGDIGFWPPGNALAIFFGPTPMSRGSEPVPASAVNIVGRVTDDATLLKKEKGAASILIEKSAATP
jgi:uncharacterized protein